MRKPWIYPVLGLLGATFALQIQGCSVVLPVIGSVVDSKKPKTKLVPTGEVTTVRPGQSVTLLLEGGGQVTGTYVRHVRLMPQDYGFRYDEWRENDPAARDFPELGTEVMVRGKGLFARGPWRRLLAFGNRTIEVESKKGSTETIPMSFVSRLETADGTGIEGDELRRLMLTGAIPINAVIELEGPDRLMDVPLDDVEFVRLQTERHSARNGFIAGLAIDALVLVIVGAAMDQSMDYGSSGCSYTGGSYYTWVDRELDRAVALASDSLGANSPTDALATR